MRKEIFLCDMCKKELQENEIIERALEFRRFEVCEKCSEKIEKANQELEFIRAKRNQEMDAIFKKYGFGVIK